MEQISVLFEKAQAGDAQARKVLIEENLGLVHAIVRRFSGRGYDPEDLFQIGTIGLMKAVDRFDLSFQVRFSTYAVPLITGEIKRFLRDDGMVKVSRTLKEINYKVNKEREALTRTLGREPKLLEVCKQAGVDYEDAVMAMEAGCEVDSLYRTIYQEDGGEIRLLDKVSKEMGSQDSEKEAVVNHLFLGQLLETLSETERTLLTMRYFKDCTQNQIAKQLGISQVQVSRMEKRILLKLRQMV